MDWMCNLTDVALDTVNRGNGAMDNTQVVKFCVSTSKAGERNEKHTVTIEKGLDQMAVASLYAKDDMYLAGLEKDYTKLVDLGVVAEGLRITLEAYYELGRLDEDMWETIMGVVFGRFIERQRKYLVVEAFIQEGEGW